MDYNGYYHEYFLRHRPHLLGFIHRTKHKGTGVRGKTDPESEPDFYRMPFVTQMDTTHDSLSLSVTEPSVAVNQQNRDSPQEMNTTRASSSPNSLYAILQVSQNPNASARCEDDMSSSYHINFSKPQSVSQATAVRFQQNSPLLPARNSQLSQTVSVADEASLRSDSLSMSLSTILSIPECDFHHESHDSLEPTPLPPVYVRRQGEEDRLIETAVPVARHPAFCQIEQNTFVFVDTDSEDGSRRRSRLSNQHNSF
jgi:hypothetical protein